MIGSVIRLRQQVKYVLIDTYSTKAFYFALVVSQVCRILGMSYMPVLRGGDLPGRLESSPRLASLVFSNATKIISPSGYLKAALEKKGFPCILIPNNIPIVNYPVRIRSEVRPHLLWVRSFSSIYNPTLAIHLVNRLLEKYPDVKLCMIGPDKDGSLHECKSLAQALGINDRIEFTGLLSKQEWIKKSDEFDIFINTTNFDNTPVSVMEAMALGFPVVTTKVGGIPYLFKDKKEGVMVAPESVDAFVGAVIYLIENPQETLLISKQARAKAEQWDWQVVKQKWQNLLHV
jgi:glycosyltransferase involved in cell wall biosynthesis